MAQSDSTGHGLLTVMNSRSELEGLFVQIIISIRIFPKYFTIYID